jgi:hypothetical protein
MKNAIVDLKNFILAIRDAGYKGTSAAIAELIDNAFEADAKKINIEIFSSSKDNNNEINIIVVDDGIGMTPSVLKSALQFGGSSRFGSRNGAGRYGMGLPNSSVSQARRLDVYTWTNKNSVWWSYLDVDEISGGEIFDIPKPRKRKLGKKITPLSENHGTIIKWTNCDRLSYKQIGRLTKKLKYDLGRTFRMYLWSGRSIKINGDPILPVDPLFFKNGNNLIGALPYGSKLEYDIKIPVNSGKTRISKIKVSFVELPIKKWFSLPNTDKRIHRISKQAGVSILRSGREIDYGWYFMGEKRKENYDDWWRCQVEFSAELDEFFGVTHIKQGITPSHDLTAILTPDLEAIAHKLNSRVRSKFLKLKERSKSPSEKQASNNDIYFDPPSVKINDKINRFLPTKSKTIAGLEYILSSRAINQPEFYHSFINDKRLQLILNQRHPFFDRFYNSLAEEKHFNSKYARIQLELLIFAAARAESQFISDSDILCLQKFKERWSNILSNFLL